MATRAIEYLSDGINIRGDLHLPDGEAPFPIVILGHGLSGLRQWTLPEVGDALAEAGIAALWFDYRNFGDSGGQPRDEVSHYGRLQDWQNAISYATSLPEIDPTRIGIWGTSLGGRDVLTVASFDRRVKAIVAQAPLITWTPALATRMAGFGTDIEAYLEAIAEDRTNRAHGKEPRYVPFVKTSGDDVKAAFIQGLSEDEKRNYSGRITFQSYQLTGLADVLSIVGQIAPAAVLFILSEEDFLPGQQEAYKAAMEPKSLVTIKGNHFSGYTTSKADSIKATKEWFVKYLIESS